MSQDRIQRIGLFLLSTVLFFAARILPAGAAENGKIDNLKAGMAYSHSSRTLYKFSMAKENEYNLVPRAGEKAYGLYSMKLDGSERKLLRAESGSFPFLAGDRLYFVEGKTNAIVSVRTDGTGYKKIASEKSSDYILEFRVEGDWVYYRTSGDKMYTDKVFRVKTDGTGKKMLATGALYSNLSLAGDWIWVDGFSFVLRMKKDGTSKSKVLKESLLSTDDNKVYTKGWDSGVYQRNADGSGKKQVFAEKAVWDSKTGNNHMTEIRMIKDGWIYYTVRTHGLTGHKVGGTLEIQLYRVTTEGKNKTRLHRLTEINATLELLGLLGDRLFYTTRVPKGDSELWSMRPDGTDKRKFVEMSDEDARAIQRQKDLNAEFAPYTVKESPESYAFYKGDEPILTYQKHDSGMGWTVNLHHAERDVNLQLLQKVLDRYEELRFSEEQLQQMKDLVAGGKKESIDIAVGAFTVSVTHRFMDEP